MNTEQQQNIVGDSKAVPPAAERIDTLVALDIPSRGVIGKLYAITCNKSNVPLCLQAARKLKEIPKGEDAKGGGIVPVTPVDVLVPAAVSNWGAYGIVACLALLEGNVSLAHTLEQEQRVLERASQQGLIDGISGYVQRSVDGLDASIHQSVITLLKQIVVSALEKLEKGIRNGN